MSTARPANTSWSGGNQRTIVAVFGTTLSTATVQRPNGDTSFFTKTGSGWAANSNVSASLVQVFDGASNFTGWRYTTPDDEVEIYDASGKLLSLIDRRGLTQSLTYSDGSVGPNGGFVLDAQGNPTAAVLPANLMLRISDAFGRIMSFSYDASMRIAKMSDPTGGVFLYRYDTNNNLSMVTYPDGKIKTYLYGEVAYTSGAILPHALTGIIDENGARFATYQYDTQGRSISTEHAGGVEKATLDYTNNNSGNGATVVTDTLGTSRTYNFQTILGVVKSTGQSQPGGSGCGPASSAITYDANGNVASRTDFNGNRTNYTYDLARNLETSRTEGLTAAGASTPITRTITTAWHPTYRLPTLITEPGRTTATTHDASGNVLTQTVTDTAANTSRTTTYTYNQYGQVLTSDGPRSDVTDVTTYTYDTQGNVATLTNAKGHVTTIAQYDASGRPKKIIDPNGLETLLDYFPRGWLKSRATGSAAAGYITTTYDYDGVGQLKRVTLPDLSFLAYDYDGAHRLIRITDTLGNKIDYTLDNIGNRISETSTDPQGALVKAHTRQYDALNRLFKDIGGANPLTQITTLAYDANGNPTSSTDPLARVTTQSYDALNRLTQVIDPFNGAAKPTQYTYNAQDQLTQVTDPKGLATAYTYNGLGEMLTQTSPDTGVTSFTYDAAGNLKTKTDARNITATYSYDELNRVTSISYPAAGSDAAETVTYSYDGTQTSCPNGIGRLCTLTDKTGTTSYTYDLYGRITAKSQTVGALTQTMSYAYNSAGQLASITTPSGKSVTYAYLNNRPVSVALNGATILDQGVYEPFGPVGGWRWGNSTPTAPNFHVRVYDKDYRASSVTSDRVGAGNLTRNYTWSDVSTLSAITDPASAVNSFTYGYDSLDRLTNAVAAGATPATFGYSYDGDGNRLTQTVGANTPANTTTYTYPTTSNRLASLTGASAKAYQYDAVGNLTNDGLNTWNYGGNNRPTQVSNAAATTQFLINALGQRVKKSSAGTDQRFVYDEAGRLWGEYDSSGALIAETIWFNDLPVAVFK